MELYKFVKDRELKQNHILTYHAGDLDEKTSKIELFGGISIPSNLIKSVFSFGIKGSRIWSRKKISKVDSNHIIEGDQLPRMVYMVYKLGQPLHGTKQNKEESIEGQISMIERLFTKRKKYPRFHHKSVHQQFMFYACVELDVNSSYKWPEVFVVGERNIQLNSLSHDLKQWNCIATESEVIVKNSNAYLKFQTIPTQLSKEKVMLFAYLNSVRKFECEKCSHEWSLSDFWELLESKRIYSNHSKQGVKRVISDSGFKLQTMYHSCGLWMYYFPSNAFIQKSKSEGANTFSNLFKWLLNV